MSSGRKRPSSLLTSASKGHQRVSRCSCWCCESIAIVLCSIRKQTLLIKAGCDIRKSLSNSQFWRQSTLQSMLVRHINFHQKFRSFFIHASSDLSLARVAHQSHSIQFVKSIFYTRAAKCIYQHEIHAVALWRDFVSRVSWPHRMRNCLHIIKSDKDK